MENESVQLFSSYNKITHLPAQPKKSIECLPRTWKIIDTYLKSKKKLSIDTTQVSILLLFPTDPSLILLLFVCFLWFVLISCVVVRSTSSCGWFCLFEWISASKMWIHDFTNIVSLILERNHVFAFTARTFLLQILRNTMESFAVTIHRRQSYLQGRGDGSLGSRWNGHGWCWKVLGELKNSHENQKKASKRDQWTNQWAQQIYLRNVATILFGQKLLQAIEILRGKRDFYWKGNVRSSWHPLQYNATIEIQSSFRSIVSTALLCGTKHRWRDIQRSRV